MPTLTDVIEYPIPPTASRIEPAKHTKNGILASFQNLKPKTSTANGIQRHTSPHTVLSLKAITSSQT